MFSFIFGHTPAVRKDFQGSVEGIVVGIKRAESFEEKCGGFDIEIFCVECSKTSKVLECARFSTDEKSPDVSQGSRVRIRYTDVLDPEDYGTVHKIQSVMVLNP